jgi:flagellar biogenesis protein FliO
MSIRNRIRDRFLTTLAFAVLMVGFASGTRAGADQPTPTASLSAPASRPFPARGTSTTHQSSAPEGGSGWWVGTVGVALALALCGWVSVASKRYLPKAGVGSVNLRVLGRTSLTPKQSVYLVQVGDRVLIVGGGGQGAPSLLGELSDPEALATLVPRPPTRLESRVGDNR